jgi:3D (Asp-Asp-Asp) domain-containing protein
MQIHRARSAILGAALLMTGFTACAAAPELEASTPLALKASATAYCQSGITRSGEETRRGVIAADPRVLPLGSVVRIDAPQQTHDGVYRVLDTGSAIKGRIVDIYMPSCRSARRFGRRDVVVYVLDWGDGKRRQRGGLRGRGSGQDR